MNFWEPEAQARECLASTSGSPHNNTHGFPVDPAHGNPYRERRCMNDLSRPIETSAMAETHDPASGPADRDTGIQALKAPDTGIQPIKPEASASAVSSPVPDIALGKRRQARLARVDRVLTGLLLLLTFFLGSFAVFNADIWMHLASGRLMARGEYQFGIDPFAYTTADVLWVNQSWLFDWLVNLLYSSPLGGEGLVAVKALLLVGLALVLLR